MNDDTIFALASGKGRAGVAVIRLSGDKASTALVALTGKPTPKPRTAALRTIQHPEIKDVIDQGLVIFFPTPNSFTGEDVAELHLHGGPAVINAAVTALGSLKGLRPAEPGEFSRRAFENDKLDLTQAEGIADLVAAETDAQRHQALRQMDGALGEIYEGWRADLIRALAYLEAELDFPDEEEVPDDLFDAVLPVIGRLSDDMTAHLADGRRGEALREGFQVVITGAPNVGKSSLINALAKRDVAIVSETPGTTRDAIEVRLNLGGYPVTLVDTAGLRDSDDAIEQEGVRRALARSAHADLVVEMHDARDWEAGAEGALDELRAQEAAKWTDRTGQETAAWTHTRFTVLNKADLCKKTPVFSPIHAKTPPIHAEIPPLFTLSIRNGSGLDAFLAALEAEIVQRMGLRDSPSLTRERHRQALQQAVNHLKRAQDAGARAPELPELIAEDVRLAARALGQITGRVDVEDILDVVFKDFCIGK